MAFRSEPITRPELRQLLKSGYAIVNTHGQRDEEAEAIELCFNDLFEPGDLVLSRDYTFQIKVDNELQDRYALPVH
jgi:hypothetical protein